MSCMLHHGRLKQSGVKTVLKKQQTHWSFVPKMNVFSLHVVGYDQFFIDIRSTTALDECLITSYHLPRFSSCCNNTICCCSFIDVEFCRFSSDSVLLERSCSSNFTLKIKNRILVCWYLYATVFRL